jgi:hypothetical protein
MHNDFSTSNCIVDDDKIVGLVDWEMAGFFGWRTAGEIHSRIRTPQREHFVNAGLSEEMLRDMMWWNDLYDDGMLQSTEQSQSLSPTLTYDGPKTPKRSIARVDWLTSECLPKG